MKNFAIGSIKIAQSGYQERGNTYIPRVLIIGGFLSDNPWVVQSEICKYLGIVHPDITIYSTVLDDIYINAELLIFSPLSSMDGVLWYRVAIFADQEEIVNLSSPINIIHLGENNV